MKESVTGTARILVVDDDEASRTMIAKILSLSGYEVESAESGDRALEMVDKEDFDLAILDYRMPGMNGVEVFERIRACSPGTTGIFLTGFPTVDTVFPAITSGIERVLAKPVDMQELLSVVQEYVTAREDQ